MVRGRREDRRQEPSAESALHPRPPENRLTVAELIDQALYHPTRGYYSTTGQRSGPHGDFITSVDAGPLFGQAIAVQLAQMWSRLGDGPLDLVEAGAGNGRLTRDILDALAAEHPGLYARVRATLVERSEAARTAAAAMLRGHPAQVGAIGVSLPDRIHGVVVANELLDALPVHVLVNTAEGLREIYLRRHGDRFEEFTGPLSDLRLAEGIDATVLPEGWRGERSLAARQWVWDVASRLERGYVLLFDYMTAGI